MKKLLAVLCAAAMLAVSCVPSFAAGSGTPPASFDDGEGVIVDVLPDAEYHGDALINPDGTAYFPAGTPGTTTPVTPSTATSGTTTPATNAGTATTAQPAAQPSTSTQSSTSSTTSQAAAPASSQSTTSAASSEAGAGDALDIVEAKSSDYPDGSKAKAVAEAFEQANPTTDSVLAAAGITGDTITTVGGKTIPKSKLTLLSKLLKFAATSGKKLPSGKFRATLPANQALVGRKAEDVVDMQVNVQSGKVDWVDVESISDAGAQTATFESDGPFAVFAVNP